MVNRFVLHLNHLAINVDYRSLALWRIATGIAILYDLIFYKLSYLEKYYFFNNLRPETVIEPYYGTFFYLIRLIGEHGFASLVIFTTIVAVFYTIGFLDKYIQPLMFICYTILVMNSIYLINGFHFMVLVSILWSVFLPTNTVWSLAVTKQNKSIHPLALYGLYLQIAFIYFTSFLVKNDSIWMDGYALEFVVQDEFYAHGMATYLRESPSFLKILSYVALVWEFLIPVFILWPFKGSLRFIAAIMIVILHGAILTIAQVGPFIIIGIAFSLVLVPKTVWDRFKNLQVDSSRNHQLTPMINSTGSFLRSGVILVFILIMIRGNLGNWYTSSHFSGMMKRIPGHSILFQKPMIPFNLLYGFKNQPWLFFQMNADSDLGVYLIVEETDNGDFYHKTTWLGDSVGDLENFNDYNFSHDLEYADFIYWVNLKDFQFRFDETVLESLLLDYYEKEWLNKNNLNKLHLIHLTKRPQWNGDHFEYKKAVESLYELTLKNI